MMVVLNGMPDGKYLCYETGVSFFVDHVKLRIAEHMHPKITPADGKLPVNVMPAVREITFSFWKSVDGTLHYKV